MVLFSYSRIYRDQRLSAQITRGIFVASYKGTFIARNVRQSHYYPFIPKALCEQIIDQYGAMILL